jgi:hypothetical protein
MGIADSPRPYHERRNHSAVECVRSSGERELRPQSVLVFLTNDWNNAEESVTVPHADKEIR